MAGILGDLIANLRFNAEDFNRGVDQALSKWTSFSNTMLGTATQIAGVSLSFAGVVAIGNQFDEVMDRMRVSTGDTGAALTGLGSTVDKVFGNFPVSLAGAGDAVAQLHTKLGLAGSALDNMAAKMAKVATITNQDIGPATEQSLRLFSKWQISTENQTGALNFLLNAAQKSGSSLGGLMSSVSQLEPTMRSLGLGFEESTAYVASFTKANIDAGPALYALRSALRQFTKEGMEPRQALIDLISAIKNAGSAAEANSLSLRVFGQRGQAMGEAIYTGKVNVDEMWAAIRAGKDTIDSAAKDINSFGEQFRTLRNNITLAVKPLAEDLLGGLTNLMPVFKDIVSVLGTLIEAFTSLPAPIQALIVIIGGMEMGFKPVTMAVNALSALVTSIPNLAYAMQNGLVGAMTAGELATAGFSIAIVALISYELGKWAYDQIPGIKALADWFGKITGITGLVNSSIAAQGSKEAAKVAQDQAQAYHAMSKLADEIRALGIHVETQGSVPDNKYIEYLLNLKRGMDAATASATLHGKTVIELSQQYEAVKKKIAELTEAGKHNYDVTQALKDANAELDSIYAQMHPELANLGKGMRDMATALDDAQKALSDVQKGYELHALSADKVAVAQNNVRAVLVAMHPEWGKLSEDQKTVIDAFTALGAKLPPAERDMQFFASQLAVVSDQVAKGKIPYEDLQVAIDAYVKKLHEMPPAVTEVNDPLRALANTLSMFGISLESPTEHLGKLQQAVAAAGEAFDEQHLTGAVYAASIEKLNQAIDAMDPTKVKALTEAVVIAGQKYSEGKIPIEEYIGTLDKLVQKTDILNPDKIQAMGEAIAHMGMDSKSSLPGITTLNDALNTLGLGSKAEDKVIALEDAIAALEIAIAGKGGGQNAPELVRALALAIRELADAKDKISGKLFDEKLLGIPDLEKLTQRARDAIEAYERLKEVLAPGTAMMANATILQYVIEREMALGHSTDNLRDAQERLNEKIQKGASLWDQYGIHMSDIRKVLDDMGHAMADSMMHLFDTGINDELDRQADDLRASFAKVTDDYAKNVEDIQRQMVDLTDTNQDEMNQQVRDSKKALDQMVRDNRKALDEKLRDLRDELNKENLAYSRNKEDAATSHEKATKDIRDSLEDRELDYKHYVEEQNLRLKELEGDESESAQRQRDEIYLQLRQRGEDMDEYRRRVQEDLNAENSDFETSMTRMNEDHTSATDQIQREQEDVTNNANEELDKQTKDLQDKLNQEISDNKTSLDTKMTDLQNQLKDVNAEYEQSKLDQQAKLNELEGKHRTFLDNVKQMFINTFEAAGEAIGKMVTTKLTDLLFKSLGDLISKVLPDVGKAFDGIFGPAGSATKGMANLATGFGGEGLTQLNPVTGLPEWGAGAGGAGGAGSAGGGILSGIVSPIMAGISAVTGIFGIFQNMHQETSLNAIELNTRVAAILLGSPNAFGTGYQDADSLKGWMKSIGQNVENYFHVWYEVDHIASAALHDDVVPLLRIMAGQGGGGSFSTLETGLGAKLSEISGKITYTFETINAYWITLLNTYMAKIVTGVSLTPATTPIQTYVPSGPTTYTGQPSVVGGPVPSTASSLTIGDAPSLVTAIKDLRDSVTDMLRSMHDGLLSITSILSDASTMAADKADFSNKQLEGMNITLHPDLIFLAQKLDLSNGYLDRMFALSTESNVLMARTNDLMGSRMATQVIIQGNVVGNQEFINQVADAVASKLVTQGVPA